MIKSKKRIRIKLAQWIVAFLKKLRRYFGEIIKIPVLRADGRLGYQKKRGKRHHRLVYKNPDIVQKQIEIRYQKFIDELRISGVQLEIR